MTIDLPSITPPIAGNRVASCPNAEFVLNHDEMKTHIDEMLLLEIAVGK